MELSRGSSKLEKERGRFGLYLKFCDGALGLCDSSSTFSKCEADKEISRLTKDTTPLQRGIIRHIIVVIDLSEAMLEKDLRPTRHLLTIHYTQEFVRQYFEQNPISQLGIIGMRDGLAVRVSDMSGNPEEHIAALQALCDQEPKGSPSLQNALDMARGAL